MRTPDPAPETQPELLVTKIPDLRGVVIVESATERRVRPGIVNAREDIRVPVAAFTASL